MVDSSHEDNLPEDDDGREDSDETTVSSELDGDVTVDDILGTDAAAEASEQKLEGELDELSSGLQRERDEYLDLARRVQADFENYKKRVAKQMSDHAERAGEVLVTKLLDVLDTVDLALHHDPSGPLEQVASALRDVLTREGLERIDKAGVPFDPAVHDAVAHEDGDGDTEVIEVMRAGYAYKGRVVRPAMVKVKGNA